MTNIAAYGWSPRRCAYCGSTAAPSEPVELAQLRIDGGADFYHAACWNKANTAREWERRHGLPTLA